ncbi:MAG: hypothetical protein KDD63_28915, partial [Bacteroidetes bacterium]|nr:hypothetical protein [Bacteroidota bacterium]
GRDIKAYLENRSIEARPETWKYLAFKFVQRNKPGVIALGTILLLLFGGITTTTWQANRAKKALAQEQLARQKAESITSFLVSLFQSADPYERYDTIPGKDLTLEEFLFQSLP